MRLGRSIQLLAFGFVVAVLPQHGAQACGTKFLARCPSPRLEQVRITVTTQAQILVFVNRGSQSPIRFGTDDPELQLQLHVLGHVVDAAEGLSEAKSALLDTRYDLVIANVEDVPTVLELLSELSSDALLVPVAADRVEEVSTATWKAESMLIWPAEDGDIARTIDEAMQARQKLAAR